jgi:pimeloyl-ACP methyl ester carboxylesterase
MKVTVKRVVWTVLAGGVIVVLVAVSLMVWIGVTKQSVPGHDAMRALETIDSNTAVAVEYGDWFVIRPTAVEPTAGLIIYPGAHSAVRGYVKVMTKIAEAGYLVVTPKMPLGYAFLAPNRAEEVFEAYPKIKHWFLAGHSLGGAMAGRYAAANGDRLAGLAFWDAYPPEGNNLSEFKVPTLLIHRATPEGGLPQIYKVKRPLFPKSTEWVPILGGDHGQFGDNVGGMYKEMDLLVAKSEGMEPEQWEATISRDEQQAIIVKAMLDWFKRNLDSKN